MARMTLDGLDETLESMKKLGELTGEVANAMLMVGAAHVADGLVRSAKREGHRDTGKLIESIGYEASPKTEDEIPVIYVYARGTDDEGVPNKDKAFVNNYGTTKIDETEWWEEGEAEAEPKAVAGMIEVWDEFILTGRVPQTVRANRYRKTRRK